MVGRAEVARVSKTNLSITARRRDRGKTWSRSRIWHKFRRRSKSISSRVYPENQF